MMNRSRTTHAFRLHPLNVTLMALALLPLALVAPAGADTCSDVQVPAGNTLSSHVYAKGVQIYRWNGTSWLFVAPEAMLFADAGYQGAVGVHYGGPTWESASGSKVVGTVVGRCTPNPSAIPWLLLRAVSSQGPGIYHQVTFIQRVNTVGGLAPVGPGELVGEIARVPYTADYFFYRKHR
jgi:hypothetical protein